MLDRNVGGSAGGSPRRNSAVHSGAKSSEMSSQERPKITQERAAPKTVSELACGLTDDELLEAALKRADEKRAEEVEALG